ncbi:hypothetical protein AZZ92_001399 [Escherichia coli]|nr:hypothetical protein AZZ92_001399 [Escherichia coli]
MAVSYTHLDVYKRQHLRVKTFCLQMIIRKYNIIEVFKLTTIK